MPASTLGRRPVPLVLAGALAISLSGILYRYADVSPTTGAFFRCVWAIPPLWLLSRLEDRRFGPRPWRARRLAWTPEWQAALTRMSVTDAYLDGDAFATFLAQEDTRVGGLLQRLSRASSKKVSFVRSFGSVM